MFEFIRTHQRLMQFLLLLIIFPSFAFFGLEGYTRMTTGENAVAKVAGIPITQQELDAAHQEQLQRYRQMFGAQFDAKMFDTPEARRNQLDSLIAKRVLAVEAARKHVSVSDQSLQQAILAIPELIGADGKFDGERYKQILAAQGMNPQTFEARMRQDMALQLINGAVQGSAFLPRTVAAQVTDISEQEREIQELTFKAADFTSQVKLTDAMLKAYYDKHGQAFEIPEQVKAEYVVLNNDAVAAQISVSDADVKGYYDQNIARYTVPEQRRASHILIEVKKSATDAEKAAAKAKAEQLLAQLRKKPSDFAKLAKENSQDPSSAERGGDVDYFGKGMMVKQFEDAAYKLKQGEISDVVQSEFGYHIIELTGIKPGSTRPFEEVKPALVAEIKKQQSAKKYSELAEIFSNTVYEQADSLKPVADKLKLKIETVTIAGREPSPTVAPTAPYNNPKFLKALYSDEAIKNKHNTEAVEVAPATLVAGRVVEYKPAGKKPFEEVKAAVQQGATQEAAAELARKAGEAKLAELKAKPDAAATGFSPANTVSRAKAQGVPPPVFTAVMKADATKLPAYVGVDMTPQGYGVYRINKVAKPAAGDPARRQSELQQVAGAQAQNEMAAYLEVLKKKNKTEILKPPVKQADQPPSEQK
jgi:peptidyl-prolyl cis-trans isomerase D